MQKRCICIKNYRDYIIGDETFYSIGNRNWFLGGSIILPSDFKEHFKPIEKQVKYFPFTIAGERAEEAANALEQEERNLDYLYDGIAPDRTGYTETKLKILAKIKQEFNVEIN